MTAWVRSRLVLTNQQANGILKVGRRLRELPVTVEALDPDDTLRTSDPPRLC